MFGIDASEFVIIAIVALVVIGPRDLPLALRAAGKSVAQMRKISGHFRSGLDAIVREAEMEELRKREAEQRSEIVREHPESVEEKNPGPYATPQSEPLLVPSPAVPEIPAFEPKAELLSL